MVQTSKVSRLVYLNVPTILLKAVISIGFLDKSNIDDEIILIVKLLIRVCRKHVCLKLVVEGSDVEKFVFKWSGV